MDNNQKPDRKKLRNLIKIYNFSNSNLEGHKNIEDEILNFILIAYNQYFNEKINKVGLLELASFLHSCSNSEITLSGMISNPNDKEKKSYLKKVTIKDKVLINNLKYYINLLISNEISLLLKFNFELPKRKKLSEKEIFHQRLIDGFVELYSQNEIENVLDSNHFFLDLYNYGELANYWRISKLIFKRIDLNFPTISLAKKYRFIYDCLQECKIISFNRELESNKTKKYETVKYWRNAYNNEHEKLLKKISLNNEIPGKRSEYHSGIDFTSTTSCGELNP